ncbi:MAG: SCP2 sterol-binding domain-containing protein [Pseudomonadota bacterium]
MSDVVNAAIAALAEKTADADIDFSVRFDIEGEGSVRVDPEGVTANEGEADVIMSADVETFQGIMSGDVNPTAAFMSQRLSVDGDMALAMKLGSILS